MEVPITSHSDMPSGVPLVADFHDMRNRLSYYYPILRDIVNVPITKFVPISGSYDSYPEIEYREITRFMQDQQMRRAFVRGDYSSAKYDADGRIIESQDPYDIESTVIEMMRQLARGKRHLGERIAVREYIPHDTEIRFFLRDGEVYYPNESVPRRAWSMARRVAKDMDHYAWSCDLIQHEDTGKWYVIDMGLDGLYYSEKHGWTEHSEHTYPDKSPEQYVDEMSGPEAFTR